MDSGSVEVWDNAYYIPLLIVGFLSSSLSILGSLSVMYMTIKDFRTRILHRLIFGLSMADFISSTTLLLMPFSIPSDLGLALAAGTHETCTTSGFFFTMNVMVGACFNTCLSIYYFLLVRRSWKESDFTRWIEIPTYAFVVLIPFSTNLATALTESFNPNALINNVCGPGVYAWDCIDDCERSSNRIVTIISAVNTFLIGSFSIVGFVCTGIVWFTVESSVRRSAIYRFQGDIDQSQANRVREVKVQALLYTLVYINSSLWPSIAFAVLEAMKGNIESIRLSTGIYIFNLLWWAFYPIQGFLNFFVFTRIEARKRREANPDRSLFWIYEQIVFSRKAPTGNGSRLMTSQNRSGSRPSAASNTQDSFKIPSHEMAAGHSFKMPGNSDHMVADEKLLESTADMAKEERPDASGG